MDQHILAGTRVGVLGKGGAGKSTLTVLLAKSLRRLGYEVCVLDADSTNLGLDRVLGLPSPPAPLIEYFGGTVFIGGRVSCPVDDPSPLPGARVSVEELPKNYYSVTSEGILYLVAGKIGEYGPGSGCDGPVSKIVRDVRIVGNREPYVTLIDFKAGFEEIARGVVASLDHIVVVVDPTTAAIQMASDLYESVRKIRGGVRPATKHLQRAELVAIANLNFELAEITGFFVVLNRVRDPEGEIRMIQRLRGRGLDPTLTIPDDLSIAGAWLEEVPFELQDEGGINEMIRQLEESATPKGQATEVAQ